MKPLSIFLSNLTYDTISIATDAFPLNVACIGSYAKKIYGDQVDITLFKYIDELEKLIHDNPPDILGMSNYIWNYNLSLEFFRQMKKIYPETLLVWGGPNFPLDWPSQEQFMKTHSEFDIYVPMRGETGFSNIIKKLLKTRSDFDKKQFLSEAIPGCISKNFDGKIFYAFENDQLKSLDDIPSPYLTGMMDKFFDGKLNPLIQTSRGCPFSCTFCTDGTDMARKVTRFSQKYVDDELFYIAKKIPDNVHTLHIADLNFGMISGDLDTCNTINEIQKIYNYPQQIIASTGKNKKEQIIESIKSLNGTMSLTMSVQSMDHNVLKNIKRDNINLDHMLALAPTIKETGLLTKAEIILNLPGETYDTTIESIRKLVQANMDDITIHTCILLHGSEMNTPEERKKWNFKTKFRIVPRDFCTLSNGKRICENEEVIVSSDTMTFEEYIELRLLALVLWINTKGIVYDPLLKFLREQNVDVFNLHYIMVKNRISANPVVNDLFTKFKNTTENELFDTSEEIISLIQDDFYYQKLLDEEIGINAIQSYHGYVLSRIIAEWTDYILDIAKLILDPKLSTDSILTTQFNNIKKFTKSISANPLDVNRMSNNPEDYFEYDIPSWLNNSQNKPLESFKFTTPKKILFKFSEQQYKIVQDTLNRYPDSMSGRGLALKSISMKDLWRKPIIM